jgi:Family of unknown function (DUF5309)
MFRNTLKRLSGLAGHVFASLPQPSALDPCVEAVVTAHGQGRQGLSKHTVHSVSKGARVRRYLRGLARTFRELGLGQGASVLFKPGVASLMAAPAAGGADVVGQRSTTNVPERTLEVDMRQRIMELEPSATPFLILSKRAKSEYCINPKYSWWEDKLNARFDTVKGAQTNVTTAVEVNNAGIWAADDLGYNTRTGEVFRVTANDGAGNLTVVRGVGGGNLAMEDGDELILIGSAAEEGALDKPARTNNPAEITNYTQIFRDGIDTTGTRRATQDRTTPRDWLRQVNRTGIEHAKSIEYAAMLGRPSINTSGTNARRTTAGFNYFATQNITDVGGLMTEQEFFNALTPCFRYGSDTKMAACSAQAVDIITAYPRSKIIVENADPKETYGIKVVQILTPHGNLNLVTHWLLEGEELSKQIWIVDQMNLGYRYLNGSEENRDTHIRHDIQAPGQDGKKDEYLTECGFEIMQPLTHGKIINITS